MTRSERCETDHVRITTTLHVGWPAVAFSKICERCVLKINWVLSCSLKNVAVNSYLMFVCSLFTSVTKVFTSAFKVNIDVRHLNS